MLPILVVHLSRRPAVMITEGGMRHELKLWVGSSIGQFSPTVVANNNDRVRPVHYTNHEDHTQP
jgi:hypothetical protein